MTRTRALVLLVAGIAAATIAGCGPRSTFFGARLPASCKTIRAYSIQGEACVGWVFDRMNVLAVDDQYDDPRLAAYVTGIATRIAEHNRLRVPTVRVIDRGTAPAYARPGGYVYVSRDMLSLLSSEAELAGVIAHEMAHGAAGHTADMLDAFPEPLIDGQDGLRDARSRDDEATADELAVGYLAAAGYAPDAMRTALLALDRATNEALARELVTEALADAARKRAPAAPGEIVVLGPDAVDAADAVSGAAGPAELAPIVDERHAFPPVIDARDPTHPAMAERLARVARLVAGRTDGELGAERYREHVAGIVVGADPRRGVLIGSTWISARLGLAVDLPPGWETDGEETKVAASAKTHEATVWAIGKDWGDAVVDTLVHRRTMQVAGHRAVIGLAEAGPERSTSSTMSMALDAPRPPAGSAVAVITVGRRALALYLSGEDVERQLAFVLGRVRPLRSDEVAAAVPTRLVFHPAPFAGSAGAVIKSLCAMPVDSAWLEDTARAVKAGDPVKCVEK